MRLVFVLLLVGLLAPSAVAQVDPYDPGPDWTLAGDERVSIRSNLSVDRGGTVWFGEGPHDIDSLHVAANA